VPSAPDRVTLNCANVPVELACNDPAVLAFAVEYFDPWFPPTQRPPEWTVRVTSDATHYRELQRRQPSDARPRPCFAHDQQVLSLDAWSADGVVNVCDPSRSCFLRICPRHVDLIGDPSTQRWRFTLLWIVQEIAATRFRKTRIDLHAASVEHGGRAMLIAGPKNAGKTTLSLHLVRSAGCQFVANDRSFVGAAAPGHVVEGMPTAVKIRPPTLASFPELLHRLPPVARPYLYSLAELEGARPSDEEAEGVDFALTPIQIAVRLAAGTRAAAPLGAIVFPRVVDDEPSWELEPLPPFEVAAGLSANLYGAAIGERPTTIFEENGDGRASAPPGLIEAIAAGTRGFSLRLGRAAYAGGTLNERLIEIMERRWP